MFDNIGGKIKTLAVVLCILGMIASFVAAIFLWTQNSRYNSTILAGFLTLGGGCLISWIGSFFTYGFGQLIESAEETAENTWRIADRVDKILTKLETPTVGPETRSDKWRCRDCGTDNNAAQVFCRNCGTQR